MTSKTIMNLAAMFLAVSGYAQKYTVPVMSTESASWGYANEEGAVFIPLQYRNAGPFSDDGWAVVQDQNNEYFFLGINGGRRSARAVGVTAVKGDFHDGLIAVKVGNKWGYLNTAGKIVIETKYDDPTEFNEGYAAANRDGKFYVLNTRGEETNIDTSRIAGVRHFSQKLAPFESRDRFGFIDEKGKIAIPAIYHGVGYFSDGIAWARVPGSFIGILNTKGEWVFAPQFSCVINPHTGSGWTRCKGSRGWVYVNASGEVLKVSDCEAWGDFANGLAPGKKNGLWGFFDSSGKWVIEPKFGGVRDFKNGFAAAKMKGKWGMIDKSGKWIIQPVWGGIKDMARVE